MALSELEALRPTERRLVMDLVRDAGLDVSDWANYDGPHAASNPRYCYEWVFVGTDRIAACLWFDSIKIDGDGRLTQRLNLWRIAKSHENLQRRSVVARRARSLDEAIQTAYRKKLPVRAIVVDGKQADLDNRNDESSKVERRFLDPEAWHVAEYDWTTGDCLLVRGFGTPKYVDQFEIAPLPAERALRTSTVFNRSALVRQQVLDRAEGHCEFCGIRGFETSSGSIYLETHHVIPLSEGGADTERNVAALCPDHHRQAHYGASRDTIRVELLTKLGSATDTEKVPG